MIRLVAQSDLASLANSRRNDSAGAEIRIQHYVELAVQSCGSAAALARVLDVKPPTVSQWRTGSKKPDAVHLLRIQDLVK
jgi:hypothetical protein